MSRRPTALTHSGYQQTFASPRSARTHHSPHKTPTAASYADDAYAILATTQKRQRSKHRQPPPHPQDVPDSGSSMQQPIRLYTPYLDVEQDEEEQERQRNALFAKHHTGTHLHPTSSAAAKASLSTSSSTHQLTPVDRQALQTLIDTIPRLNTSASVETLASVHSHHQHQHVSSTHSLAHSASQRMFATGEQHGTSVVGWGADESKQSPHTTPHAAASSSRRRPPPPIESSVAVLQPLIPQSDYVYDSSTTLDLLASYKHNPNGHSTSNKHSSQHLSQTAAPHDIVLFPTITPTGQPHEIARLQQWFHTHWQAIETSVGNKGGGGDGNDGGERMSMSMERADTERERLCVITFHELLRHITALTAAASNNHYSPTSQKSLASGPSSSTHARDCISLLSRVWHEMTTNLLQRRLNHRLDACVTVMEHDCQDRVNAIGRAQHDRYEQTLRLAMQTKIQLEYLRAESDAKTAVIEKLHTTNDEDLLYHHQTIANKELEHMKLEREMRQVQEALEVALQAHAQLKTEKTTLEQQFHTLEDSKEELQTRCSTLQEILDARQRLKHDAQTQYVKSECPIGATEDEHLTMLAAAQKIQAVFRGHRVRAVRKQHGTYRGNGGIHSSSSMMGLNSGAGGTGGAVTGGRKIRMGGQRQIAHTSTTTGPDGKLIITKIYVPIIPRAFQHLLNPTDFNTHRAQHFPRMFARSHLLKWISRLYEEKRLNDLYTEKHSHLLGHKKEFADFLYDWYLQRHGSRDSAEMDLMDLFASIERHLNSSGRIAMFHRFLNCDFKHRTLKPGEEYNVDGVTEREGEDEWALDEHLKHIGRKHEFFAETLRCKLSMQGGRSLSSRVFDFYIRFWHVAQLYGIGPFQTVSDDNEGKCWVDVTSMCEIVSHVFVNFKDGTVAACVQKMQLKAATKHSQAALQGNNDTLHRITSVAHLTVNCTFQYW